MTPFSPSVRATLIGLCAPLCWGTSVGLFRSISEDIGIARGLTVLYILSVALLVFFLGRPKLSDYSPKYQVLGITMANLRGLCFAFSLALSEGGTQTMQVAMINYLWPSLTVLFAILFNGTRARWWVVLGLLLSLAGVSIVIGGDAGFSWADFEANLARNPWSYAVSFTGALSWATYCSMTRAWHRGGPNPVVLTFSRNILVFAAFWAAGSLMEFDYAQGPDWVDIPWRGWVSILVGAVVIGGANAAWNYGVARGSMALLGVASYFTPVLSCLFAMVWIDATLSGAFWKGVLLIVAGSLISWEATRSAAGKPLFWRTRK